MQEMSIKDVKRYYNRGHFGNQPIQIGAVCWVLVNDKEYGLHEFPVIVVE